MEMASKILSEYFVEVVSKFTVAKAFHKCVLLNSAYRRLSRVFLHVDRLRLCYISLAPKCVCLLNQRRTVCECGIGRCSNEAPAMAVLALIMPERCVFKLESCSRVQ